MFIYFKRKQFTDIYSAFVYHLYVNDLFFLAHRTDENYNNLFK